jgi:hypothetical protein
MARSSRPELIKDNPPAPQVYVRWRKKRDSLHLIKRGGGDQAVHEALRRVTEAAEAFVEAAPPSKRAAVERQALTDAIVQAQRLLSRE